MEGARDLSTAPSPLSAPESPILDNIVKVSRVRAGTLRAHGGIYIDRC